MTTSIFTLGRKSTTYSAPRYNSVWPFCRPNPLTSVTVTPVTPISDSASRTSSSLNGLMIAITIFMSFPCLGLGDIPGDFSASSDGGNARVVAGWSHVTKEPVP